MSAGPSLEALLGEELSACCGSVYDSPLLRALLGDELHPGGDALSRRLAHLAGVGAGARVLDVASGRGRTARLLGAEYGAEVTGVECSAHSVAVAQREADAAGLGDRVRFVEGDAAALPAASGTYDAVVCECALCLFPNKEQAVVEMRRVLRPGGVVAIADVTAEADELPTPLRGVAGRVACLADALPSYGYEALLHDARLELVATESHDGALEKLADRVEYRLRVARMLDVAAGYHGALTEAIELVRDARCSIARGSLGYRLFVARRASSGSSSKPGSPVMARRGDGRAHAAHRARAGACVESSASGRGGPTTARPPGPPPR
jgi:SAM-dependent methyltransferase